MLAFLLAGVVFVSCHNDSNLKKFRRRFLDDLSDQSFEAKKGHAGIVVNARRRSFFERQASVKENSLNVREMKLKLLQLGK